MKKIKLFAVVSTILAMGLVACNGPKSSAQPSGTTPRAGGVATLFLVASLTIGGLYNILDYHFIFGIIICEMTAKTSLITTALLSKPLTPGIGSYFIKETNIYNYAASTAIVAVIAFLLGDLTGIIGVLGAIFSGIIIAFIARRNFVFANGDVLGMSNEFGRLFSLLFMSVALYFL